jgi:myo-inositol-1(or 4)-monophosphatase
MNLKNVLNVAVETAEAAGALLREGVREQKSILHKSSSVDLVTQYDEAAEALILERLRGQYPDHGFVAEESGVSGQSENGRKSRYTWYIDPLDGTNNFAHGFPVFCVSLALYEGEKPLVGVVYDPLRDECFSAVSGQGAFLTTPEGAIRLEVSATETLLGSLLATGFPYDRHTSEWDNMAQLTAFLKRAQGVRRPGAAALDLAYVAAGRLDGYWEYMLNIWVFGAGLLLVVVAGGWVRGLDGRSQLLAGKIALIARNRLILGGLVAVLDVVGEGLGNW